MPWAVDTLIDVCDVLCHYYYNCDQQKPTWGIRADVQHTILQHYVRENTDLKKGVTDKN